MLYLLFCYWHGYLRYFLCCRGTVGRGLLTPTDAMTTDLKYENVIAEKGQSSPGMEGLNTRGTSRLSPL